MIKHDEISFKEIQNNIRKIEGSHVINDYLVEIIRRQKQRIADKEYLIDLKADIIKLLNERVKRQDEIIHSLRERMYISNNNTFKGVRKLNLN